MPSVSFEGEAELCGLGRAEMANEVVSRVLV